MILSNDFSPYVHISTEADSDINIQFTGCHTLASAGNCLP